MTAKPRSRKQEQAELAALLRAQGKAWTDVATGFRRRFRVNARVAFRLAHGWSQREAAEQWNARWPNEPKTFKNISSWEVWPSSTGHAPSLDTLDRLAQIYECGVADLLIDCPSYRDRDSARQPTATVGRLAGAADAETALLDLLYQDSASERYATSLLVPPAQVAFLMDQIKEIDFSELARVITMSAQRLDPSLSRRELLFKLSNAFAMAAAAPLFDFSNADDHERIARAVENPERLDMATLDYTENVLQAYRRQGDVLGPQITLQTVLTQRQMIRRLVKAAPSNLRPRALSAYAELSQIVGWQLFNLGDYRAAQYYYDDARTDAHEAQNVELVTYILCTMSHLATWRKQPRVGIDHAIAAQTWAAQTRSAKAQAYAADVAARAYASDRQASRCQAALEHERAALALAAEADTPTSSWWYFHDESFYYGTKSECALQLGAPGAAWRAAEHSLKLADPANVHNYAHTMVLQAEARIRQNDTSHACRIIIDIAKLTAANRSGRMTERIGRLRQALNPWQRTRNVRALDEQLVHYGVSSGNEITNRS
jgi:hypothetical protein